MTHRKFDSTAILCLAGATLCWGIVPVLLKYLTRDIPDGFTTNAVRYPLATLLYLPWLIRGFKQPGLRRFWIAALVPALVNLVAQTLWAWVPYYMDAGLLSFLFQLWTVIGVLAAFWLLPDERWLARSRQFWAGALLAFGGFVLLSIIGLQSNGRTTVLGVVLLGVCTVTYGLYGVTVRQVMGRLNPLMVFGVISLYTSIGVLAVAPLGDSGALLELSARGWGVLVVSAAVGIGIAHGLYYIAVQRLGVVITSVTLVGVPLVTIAASHSLFGETFTPAMWGAGAVLLAGAILALWSRQQPRGSEAAQAGLSPQVDPMEGSDTTEGAV